MKKLIKYFSLTSISGDISEYGYSFSLRKYIVSIIGVTGCITLVGLIFKLKLKYILCIILCSLLILPLLIRKKYHNNHRMKEFSDVDIYLHQMVYSFIRTPKIHTALSDTYAIADGHLKELLKDALDELEYGMGDNVYYEALEIIEKNYNCSRVRTLHHFLINIETKGGRYKNALQVLLKDFDRWVKNIYQYEYELKIIKRDTTAGIFISIGLSLITMLMCSILNKYNTGSVSITNNYIFQLSSTVFLLLCIFFYAYTQTNYGSSLLNDSDKEKQSVRNYKLAYKTSISSVILHVLPLIIILIAILIFMIIKKKYLITAYILLAVLAILSYPFINKRRAKKQVINNLRSCFSDWLRNVAINLENKPLIASIEDTYDDCPYLIRLSLDNFIRNIEADPSDIKPYYEFLSEYKQTDIMATIRTLYSVSELDEKGIDETISTLIQRNNDLINKQTELSYKDKESILKFMEYIPVFFMAMKMSVDMMLIITLYL